MHMQRRMKSKSKEDDFANLARTNEMKEERGQFHIQKHQIRVERT